MTSIALLWHHHQPDYRDPARGRPVMPWTRLHALRGYRDLATALLDSGAKMTINLVPSLLDQLQWYAEGGDDPHLELTRRRAEDLDAEARAELIRSFIGGHPAMWEVNPHALRLRLRAEAGELSSAQELRDLQVWSTLAWVGWSGRRQEPVIDELRSKGLGFSEDDKLTMVEACARLVAAVLPLHRQLQALGKAEISASPYFHPILPLLIDAEHARRALPELPALPRYRWPDDALAQLIRGRERVEEVVGGEVRGLWPSEGSVSPELLPLAAEAGFRWLVSDIGNLARSARAPADAAPSCGPWALGHGLSGFFRDTDLSDAIGFRYARRPPREAVEELIAAAGSRAPLAVIALDGENPWESYADAGEGFMRALCQALTQRGGVEAETFSEACERHAPRGEVSRLHTGSWIGSDLHIWMGDAEDQAGWAALSAARDAVAAAGDPPEALEHIYAAEGSDWFWWFGKEFTTPFAADFDRLFRARLAAAWRAIGLDPPKELSLPIKGRSPEAPSVRAPTGPISPPLNADAADFFAWAAAGWLDGAAAGGAMAKGARRLRALRWGRGGGWLYLRLLHAAEPEAGQEWSLELRRGETDEVVRWEAGAAPPGGIISGALSELRVPLGPQESLSFSLALSRAGALLERHPEGPAVRVEVDRGWWV